jgi:pimeloyl-ACP methyl ester carboxylesterase
MRYRHIVVATICVSARLSAQLPDIGPAPGKLVDVGGRKLHLLCTGPAATRGAPTVVLEAGASAFSIDWTLVQREVARANRVCSYDRAGSAWSDPSKASGDANVASDLNRLLEVAGEHAPYIMVGASLGGMFVRLYQADYPNDVAGLVLVDPASEDRLFTYFEGKGVLIGSLTAEQVRSMVPQRSVTVPRRRPQTGAPFDKLPAELYELRIKLDTRLIASIPDTISPEFIAALREGERARLARLLEQRSKEEHPLGDRPIVVLSRGMESSAEMQAVHAGIARLSTNSRHTVIAGSGHEIHLFEPSAVIRAITDVLVAVREKSRLP